MNRRGFSLLEILLALAILGGTLAILSSIVITGADAGEEAADLSVARMLCQTKMSEQLLNPEIPPQPLTMTPIQAAAAPDSSGLTRWQYSVEVVPASMQGLLAIRVTVATEDLNAAGTPRIEYSLVRWIVDPALGLEEMEREAEAAAAEAAATSEAAPASEADAGGDGGES